MFVVIRRIRIRIAPNWLSVPSLQLASSTPVDAEIYQRVDLVAAVYAEIQAATPELIG